MRFCEFCPVSTTTFGSQKKDFQHYLQSGMVSNTTMKTTSLTLTEIMTPPAKSKASYFHCSLRFRHFHLLTRNTGGKNRVTLGHENYFKSPLYTPKWEIQLVRGQSLIKCLTVVGRLGGICTLTPPPPTIFFFQFPRR